MSVNMAQYRNRFLEEGAGYLRDMETRLLELRRDGRDASRIEVLFRRAHSIQGGAAMFGFSQIARLAQSLESVLDALRRGDIALNRTTLDALGRGIESAGLLLDEAVSGNSGDADHVTRSRRALRACLSITGAPQSHAVPDRSSALRAPYQYAGDVHRFVISVSSGRQRLSELRDPLAVLAQLDRLGQAMAVVDESGIPDLETFDADQLYLSWVMALDTPADLDAIRRVCGVREDTPAVRIEQVGGDPASLPRRVDQTNEI